MNDEAHTKQCLAARQYYDARLAEDATDGAFTPETKASMETHLKQCADCISWQRQITDIIAEAAHIPQFDVPEALTQRIISSVALESTKKESVVSTVVMSAVALLGLALLMFSGIESTDGLASWAMALIVMAGFAWLVTDSKKETTVHEGV
ncbi:MAG TPA: hypothetical protein V6C81_15520 [Planktothrix sp.]|jgi:predicted anti-sigma-YlaC factor YlaD